MMKLALLLIAILILLQCTHTETKKSRARERKSFTSDDEDGDFENDNGNEFSGDSKSQAATKLIQITKLAKNSAHNVIELDDATYPHYALHKPYSYSLVVFYTASHSKFRCTVCKQSEKEFQLLASSYAKLIKDEKKDPSVFFIKLDYQSSSKIFNGYQLSSVPAIYYLGPKFRDNEHGDYQVAIRDRYQFPMEPDAESIANFVRDRTKIAIPIHRSMWFVYFFTVVLFGVLLALIQPIISMMPTIMNIIQFKPIWYVVSIGVYTCAISGLIYDIIRNPQMYHVGQGGQIMFFYPQSGSQFVVEGFIIGFLNLACAASAIFLAYAPSMKSTQFRDYGLVISMIVFLICFFMVRGFYRMKNRWYGMQM